MEKADLNSHREWIEKVKGTKTPEISGAKPMPGLEYIPNDGLVVSDEVQDWSKIKQPIIPVKPSGDGSESDTDARRQRMNLRAQNNAMDGFLTLVKDEKMGGQDNWTLAFINPRELALDGDELLGNMEASYIAGQTALGSSSRAAYLAKTGKTDI